jgi:hypothetical protein
MLKEKDWNNKKEYRLLLYIIIIALVNYVINADILIKSLYNDDLFLWNEYIKDSFLEFVFSLSANKFRPVFNIMIYGVFSIVGTKIAVIGVVNLVLACIIAIVLFYMIDQIINNELIGLMGAILFLLSRFSYYNINQVLGIMEAMALLMSILMLYFIYKYINQKNAKYYFIAFYIYFFIPYVHERFIILYPIFIYALIVGEDLKFKNLFTYKNFLKLILPSISFVLFFVLRICLFKEHMLDGTGGTNAIETFNITQIIKYVASQILYLLGINNGERYLCGIQWHEMRIRYKLISVMVAGILFGLAVLSSIVLIKQDKERRKRNLYNVSLFLLFIVLCIVSSSITIRVEMRWIYVTYTAMLLLVAYMIKIIYESAINKIFKKSILCLLFMFWILMIPLENYYRSYYSRLYYWSTMLTTESLYEKTFNIYGNKLWNARLVIYDKNETLNADIIMNSLRPLAKNGNLGSFEVYIIHSLSDISKLYNDNTIILDFDYKQIEFNNVTKLVKFYL